MTASCSNSDTNGSVTTTATAGETSSPPPITLSPGPVFVGDKPDDTLATVAAGDLNGDGDTDLALGAAFADGAGGADSGAVYVFYSAGTLSPEEVSVNDADVTFHGAAGDQAGRALASFDLNGDRINDLLIGAPAADADGREDAGKVYVLLGNPVFESVRDPDLASTAPAVNGADAGDFLGYTLATGDFNDDLIGDLALGAFLGDGPDNDREDAGEVHIIYGGNRPRATDLATSSLDVVVYGAEAGDHLSEGLAAGDFDGDGRDDVIAAATFASTPEASEVGKTFVITGELKPEMDLAGSVPGTTIVGADEGDQLGHSVAGLDFNGDGFEDVLVGAVSADGPDNGDDLAGEAALILGSAEPPNTIDISAGAAITYGLGGNRLGRALASGDLDNDGFVDAILIASEAPNDLGTPETGAAYVLFGNAEAKLPTDIQEAPFSLYGEDEGDNLGTQVNGIPALALAHLNRDDLADVTIAAPRASEKRGRVMVFISEPAQ